MSARSCRTVVLWLIAGALSAGSVARADALLPASPMTPYLDNQTVLIARVALNQIDTKALGPLIKKLAAQFSVPAESTPDLNLKPIDAALSNLDAAKSAGIEDAYFIIPRLGIFVDPQTAVAIFISLKPNADAASAMREVQRDAAGTELIAQQLPNHMIVLGAPETLALFSNFVPQPRPDLETPLAQSQAAFDIVLAPTADSRRVIAEMMPQLPAPLNQQSTDFISRDLIDLHLQLQSPPHLSFTLRADTRTPDAAETIIALAKRGLDSLHQDPDFLSAFRATPDATNAPFIDRLFQRLTPTVERTGDRSAAVMALDANGFNDLSDAAIPIVERAGHEAAEVASTSNLRQIALYYIMYLNNHKNAPPPSLATLIDPHDPAMAKVLINPADPQRRPYILVPWTDQQLAAALNKSPTSTPIAYEDNGLAAPMTIAFLDGHVERISDPAALRKLLTGVPGIMLPTAATSPAPASAP